jgi:hypothetical protein
MIRWKPFKYRGDTYDLTHLYPRTVRYEQTAKGNQPSRSYTADVIFSLHCFTRGFREGETPDESLLYADSRECRVFDFQRYQLSKFLPQIVYGLSQRKCYHTERGNFFSIELLSQEDGSVIEYNIFFTASRSSKKGVVNLFVQSAYVRDSQHSSNRPQKKPIGFHVILFNTLHNRPIKPPK